VFALQALVVIIAGFFLLRLAGKKVIGEMTTLEMVATLAIGTIIGHADKEVLKTIVTITVFVCVLIVFQYIALKWPFFQKLIIGKPTLVIRDGVVHKENLSKLRMTTEQLEMRIRSKGISNISDIQTATIEVSGQLGYELIKSARPVTHGEIKKLLKRLKLDETEEDSIKNDVFEGVRKSDIN
jgi:uncharacterized membrane protein YcaP (DUF421 family)